ncbi:MAG: hypothetical protein ACLUTO_04070 [Anaerostipes sp.]|uniref:hypothetical protein n=1 Tax=Anaerostipes hadrus TaxID=649756 RepID=UPI000A438CAE|nr:hypothetical protein [Anaerostipes hadrus]
MKYAQKVKKRYLTILNDMAKNRDSYVKNPEKILQEKENYPFKIPLIRLLLMMLAALAVA